MSLTFFASTALESDVELGQEVCQSFPAEQVGMAGFFILDATDGAMLDGANFNSVSTGPAVTCTKGNKCAGRLICWWRILRSNLI